MKYNKILILGGIGSGKTTLANKISKKFKIKHYELDNIVYKKRETYEKNSAKIRDKKLNSILKKNKWIIEGFYTREWTHQIYKKSDIIVILKIKSLTAQKRIILRFLKRKIRFKKYKNTNKNFKKMLKLLKYINQEEYNQKVNLLDTTAQKLNKKIITLKTKKEIKQFLNYLK